MLPAHAISDEAAAGTNKEYEIIMQTESAVQRKDYQMPKCIYGDKTQRKSVKRDNQKLAAAKHNRNKKDTMTRECAEVAKSFTNGDKDFSQRVHEAHININWKNGEIEERADTNDTQTGIIKTKKKEKYAEPYITRKAKDAQNHCKHIEKDKECKDGNTERGKSNQEFFSTKCEETQYYNVVDNKKDYKPDEQTHYAKIDSTGNGEKNKSNVQDTVYSAVQVGETRISENESDSD